MDDPPHFDKTLADIQKSIPRQNVTNRKKLTSLLSTLVPTGYNIDKISNSPDISKMIDKIYDSTKDITQISDVKQIVQSAKATNKLLPDINNDQIMSFVMPLLDQENRPYLEALFNGGINVSIAVADTLAQPNSSETATPLVADDVRSFNTDIDYTKSMDENIVFFENLLSNTTMDSDTIRTVNNNISLCRYIQKRPLKVAINNALTRNAISAKLLTIGGSIAGAVAGGMSALSSFASAHMGKAMIIYGATDTASLGIPSMKIFIVLMLCLAVHGMIQVHQKFFNKLITASSSKIVTRRIGGNVYRQHVRKPTKRKCKKRSVTKPTHRVKSTHRVKRFATMNKYVKK
jgi:hypothetical protein